MLFSGCALVARCTAHDGKPIEKRKISEDEDAHLVTLGETMFTADNSSALQSNHNCVKLGTTAEGLTVAVICACSRRWLLSHYYNALARTIRKSQNVPSKGVTVYKY